MITVTHHRSRSIGGPRNGDGEESIDSCQLVEAADEAAERFAHRKQAARATTFNQGHSSRMKGDAGLCMIPGPPSTQSYSWSRGVIVILIATWKYEYNFYLVPTWYIIITIILFNTGMMHEKTVMSVTAIHCFLKVRSVVRR